MSCVVKIRPAKEEDMDKGLLETLDNLNDGSSGMSVQSAKGILRSIDSTTTTILVAVYCDSVVGAGTLLIEQKLIHNGGKVGHIEDIVTRKGYERKGIATLIVVELIDIAKMSGCYKVILDCSKNNIVFYRKLGFREYETGMRLDL